MPIAGHGVSQQSGFVVERVLLTQAHDDREHESGLEDRAPKRS